MNWPKVFQIENCKLSVNNIGKPFSIWLNQEEISALLQPGTKTKT
jgi:hypothetical protein